MTMIPFGNASASGAGTSGGGGDGESAAAGAGAGNAGGAGNGAEDAGGASAASYCMEIRFAGGPEKVSHLSGLFWTLQAAVRDVGDESALLLGYTQRRGPFLVAEVAAGAGDDDGGFAFRIWFANEHHRPLPKRTRAIFDEFFRGIATAARRGDQHTFWGRPAGRMFAGDEESRMQRFVSTLRSFDDATIVYGEYRLTLINGSIRLERGQEEAGE